jgi:hypothetical protein
VAFCLVVVVVGEGFHPSSLEVRPPELSNRAGRRGRLSEAAAAGLVVRPSVAVNERILIVFKTGIRHESAVRDGHVAPHNPQTRFPHRHNLKHGFAPLAGPIQQYS